MDLKRIAVRIAGAGVAAPGGTPRMDKPIRTVAEDDVLVHWDENAPLAVHVEGARLYADGTCEVDSFEVTRQDGGGFFGDDAQKQEILNQALGEIFPESR